ncbi:MAG TPA: SDR family oxidoreductase [Candidatus Acidoferrum sp.]|nr:SDR family oxidoreductase [Candidatus Acidoferrum sp.]
MVDLRTNGLKLLNDKVAIVTGANVGIGKGIAQAFASEGAKVVLAARNVQRLNAVADELRSQGGIALSVPTDVSHEPEVIALFETTMREFGRLDILVNNAGVSLPATLEQTSLEIWQRTLDVNLTGPFLCTREAMKIMKPQGGGRIINIGSISAQMPRANFAAYGCSKAGLLSLTKTTALDGRNYGIVAGCIHPGNTNTSQMTDTPGEPAMEVDDVVKVVMAMATLPLNVNMFETIVLPVAQLYLGRG